MSYKTLKEKTGKCLFIASLLLPLALSSCSRNISSDIYTEESINETYATKIATVIDRRNIKVQEKDKLKEGEMGVVGGAVGGAAAGSQLSKGKGSTITTITGAILGALGGSILEKKLNTQDAFEYIIQLDNEPELKTIIQSGKPIEVGRKVYFIEPKFGKGRARIRPTE